MITIENLRSTRIKNPYDVRVDRSSILGNPFHMDGENTRDAVCDRFEAHFLKVLESSSGRAIMMKEELYRISQIYHKHGKLRLFCWCAPKRCHAETIRKYLLGHLISE